MMHAIWRVADDEGTMRLAIGDSGSPTSYLPKGLTLVDLLSNRDGLALSSAHGLAEQPVGSFLAHCPADGQPIWAAGVTFARSRSARIRESGGQDFYDRVYGAARPELFLKAIPGDARGSNAPLRLRADSTWDVPEPELTVVVDSAGDIVGCCLGNDLSSRSIEAENPLYLPQAKVWRGSCAIGPCIVTMTDEQELLSRQLSLTVSRAGVSVYSDQVSLTDMRRRPSELVSWLYRELDFPSGAFLMTGTSIVPPDEFTLRASDRITISAPGLGELVNWIEA